MVLSSMKAKSLLTASAHPPEVLSVVFTAFDLAWEEMQRDYPAPASAAASERERLATVMLHWAGEGASDPHALKNAALAVIRNGGR